ncbi:hypothetical protein GCM10007301_26960 [Azorhizobium oxalatiphilum]|uniref:Uncharacterized protein n=1 Tax=Azorhizobium oxalatiphilum TaxID=980631 RepID=A0A917FDU5_9HYPH|nr:hypothetical protein [Azorhizobium oxalatiphilum]GGF65882.1 hypothetical protein GCM10007301_26960 [Azorhizobium oxalatiphilum]
MNIKEFSDLIEETVRKAGGAQTLSTCISKPSTGLMQQFGPLTDKVMKDKAAQKARALYLQFKDEQQFADALATLATVVDNMPSKVSNGAIEAMSALHYQKDKFASNLDTVLRGVKEPSGGMRGVILAAMDTAVTMGLAFVPVAGPFLVPLSQGLANALAYGCSTAIQKGTGNDNLLVYLSDPSVDKESALGQLASQKGLVSLLVTAVELAIKRNERILLSSPDALNGRSFANLLFGRVQTQNQNVSFNINTLEQNGLRLPDVLNTGDDRTKYYLDEKKTLEQFKDKTSEMFVAFEQLILQVMSAGIKKSFEPATRPLADLNLTEGRKIALLLLGYYYAKNWGYDKAGDIQQTKTSLQQAQNKDQQLQTELRDLQEASPQAPQGVEGIERDQYYIRYQQALLELPNTRGKIQSNAQTISNLQQKLQQLNAPGKLAPLKTYWSQQQSNGSTNAQDPYQLSSHATYEKATGSLKKSTFMGSAFSNTDMSLDKLPQIRMQAGEYLEALKDALTSDIATTMNKGNSGRLDDKEMQEMWKVYIACSLILNEVMREAKVQENSTFPRFTSPKSAVNIDDRYIKMLEETGFIERYTGTFGRVSKEKKQQLAATNRLRWSWSASNTERAMVVAFATVVVFSMDIGKISMGFTSWKATKTALGEVCNKISLAAIS